jgi:hypothetical protein
VYFRREDYAPFWLRALVDVIDFGAIAAACFAVFLALSFTLGFGRLAVDLFLIASTAVSAGYLVVLKRSRFGTLGYRLGRVRIVGLDGQAPGYLALLVRFFFSALGPANWMVDLLFGRPSPTSHPR